MFNKWLIPNNLLALIKYSNDYYFKNNNSINGSSISLMKRIIIVEIYKRIIEDSNYIEFHLILR